MKSQFTMLLMLAFIVMVALTSTMAAQSSGGGVAGTIYDSAGAVVPNASVTLVNIATNVSSVAVSTDAGRYTFPQLNPGVYKITVIVSGFKESVQTGVTVSVGAIATQDITLQVGESTQSVVVTADAQQIQTESSDIGTTVTGQLINQLPLNFSGLVRSPLAFLTLTPGFQGSASGNPVSQASFKLNGGGTGSADIILDGSSISLASPNYQMPFGISVDAVAEFKVETSTFPAEYGRTGGGFVTIASKSGTNEIHGGVYEQLKNRVLDANSWQNNHTGLPRANDTQHDFGAFAGGPVWIPKIYNGRSKTFWFTAYEGFRFKAGGGALTSVPTPAMWNGDFSAILQTQVINGVTYPGKKIYDYTTCSGANQGKPCQPFPNNQIPLSRLDPFSKNMIALLPQATSPGQPYQNLRYTSVSPVNQDLWFLRIDHTISSKHKLYGTYSQSLQPVQTTYSYGDLYQTGQGSTKTRYVRLAEDWSITSSLLNHINFGYTRRYRLEQSINTVGQWGSKLGFKGYLEDTLIPGVGVHYDPSTSGNMPAPPHSNSHFADNSYQISDNLLWSHGAHNFKFGVDYRRQGFNAYFGTAAGPNFSYQDALTSAGTSAAGTAIDPNSGSGAASFFLGAATTGSIGGSQVASMRTRYWGMYVQDDWKVNPKLTLNLGLRYEIPEPVFESKCRTSQVNPTLPNPAAGGLPGALEFQGDGPGRDGRCSPMNQYWGSWGPRAGMSYQLDKDTVVRAAYGIYYTPLKVSNFANTDSKGFFAVGYNYTANVNQQTPSVIPSQIQSYPGVVPPNLDPSASNGLNGAATNGTGGPVFLPSRLARPGQVQNWTADIQRQLPGQWLLDVAYVGNHGAHLQKLLKDPNVGPLSALAYGPCLAVQLVNQATSAACDGKPRVQSPYPAFISDFGVGATVSQALRPFPQFQDANLDTAFSANPWGNYTYHAVQAQITKRYGSGFTVLANYTWSKNLTDSDADYAVQSGWNGGSGGVLNPYNPRAEKSYSQFDQPQSVKISYTYELPFGKGKKYMSHANAVTEVLAGGWMVGGVDTYSSGFPMFATQTGWTSGIFAGEATGGNPRPNVVPGQNVSGFKGGPYIFGVSRKLNPNAFTIAPNYTFGNAPRLLGGARYFAHKSEDLQASKRIPLFHEGVALTFRFDIFNIFNRHGWGCPNQVVGTPTFGQFTCGTGPSAEINNNVSSPSSRTMQANFRLTF
jgi:hypothetical protein